MSVNARAADQPSGLVSGIVLDATGAPLSNVTVTLDGPGDRAAPTGSDGRFSFPELPDGSYRLTATLEGFAPVSRTVRVRPGEPAALSLTMWIRAVEETVVTAARTGERDLQTIPMAVSVLSASELQRVEGHTVEDVAGRAPSVTFSQNTGLSQLTIRGIGTNVVFAGSDPSSAVYVDGVYLARPAMVLTDMLDVSRVEVLRGPQGTLYGRNAVGGALNLITPQPTNELEASARLVAGGLDSFRVEARASGPLVRNRVMGSAAFLRGVRDGFVRDLNHPDRPLGGDDVTATRAKLAVVIDRRSDLLFSADASRSDPVPLTYAKVLAVKPGFTVENPADLHEVRTSSPSESRNTQLGGSARYTLRLSPDTTLTSLTAYRHLDYDVLVDSDITELDLTTSNVHEIHHQISEELTIAGRRPRLSWIGGLFVFGDEDRQPTVVRFAVPRLDNRLDPTVETRTRALFGQATVALTSRVSAIAGLRYTHDDKRIRNQGGLYPLDAPGSPVAGSSYAYDDRITHDAWTPKVALEVRARDRLLAYASASRGFKSGGFNISSNVPGRGYAPEWAWSYEGGLKAGTARRHLNLAAFDTEYTDLQVQTAIRPGVLDISNAAAATIRGVELEGGSRIGAIQVGGHLAWLDARYDRYVAVGVGGVTGDVAGNRLTNAPAWSGRAWAEWSTPNGRLGTLSVRADARWQTTVYFTPFNDAIQRQSQYGLLDVSAELRPRRSCCTIGVYARNLANVDYITGTFGSPPPAIGGRPGEPRQVGVQLIVGGR